MSEAGSDSEDEQNDLSRAVALLAKSHDENVALRHHFEQLKGFHVSLTTAYQDLQQHHEALQQERDHVERQYQQICDGWRIELESKQAAFDEVRGQLLTPRDVDLLKLKLQEDTERPFRAKCDALSKEAESAQENFVKERRLHAGYRVQAQASISRLENELANTVAEHVANHTDLADRLRNAEQVASQLQEGQKAARAAVRARDNLLSQVRHLTQEAGDLRSQRDGAALERQTAIDAASLRITRSNATQLELQSSIDTLESRCRGLDAELRDASTCNDRLAQRVLSLQHQTNESAKQLAMCTQQHEAEVQDYQNRADMASKVAEQELDKSRLEHEEHERQLLSQLTSCKTELECARAEMAGKISIAEEPLRALLAKLEAEVRVERGALVAEKQSRQQDKVAFEKQAQAADLRLRQLQSEITDCRAEVRRWHEEHANLLLQHGNLKAELEGSLKGAMHAKEHVQSLRMQLSTLTDAKHQADLAYKQLEEDVVASKKVAEAAQADLLKEQQEHAEWVRKIGRSQAADRAIASKSSQEALNAAKSKVEVPLKRSRALVQTLTTDLKHSRDEVDDLRMKLVEAQAKIVHLPSLSDVAIVDAGSALARVPTVTKTLTQMKAQLDDLRSRQDMYLKAVPAGLVVT